ncbi:hypothetical protein Tco_1301373 [Tanacetum coccineum]
MSQHQTSSGRRLARFLYESNLCQLERNDGGILCTSNDGVAASFQLKSDSLPHAHAQTTKTTIKHLDSSIKKAQVLKTKTFAYSDNKDNSSEIKL